VVFVGEVAVKASSVDREASLPKLQNRLDPFHGPGQGQPEKPDPGSPGQSAIEWAREKAAPIIGHSGS
jgi:hypothetical protein